MICPKTFQPCCDDICRHSGCLKFEGGEPGLMKCPGGCGEYIPADGSRHDTFRCECEPVEWDDDFDDDDPVRLCVSCGCELYDGDPHAECDDCWNGGL